VQQSGASAPITVGAATGGTAVDFTGTGGTRVLTGVRAGTLSASSIDAVNGGQLYATNANVATNSSNIATTNLRMASALGGGAGVDSNGLLTAPSRHKAAPRRRARVLPYAAGTAGRAAVAVTQLPESGLIHRLTRGRAWIGLLGVLLVGIVALNVVTLSFAASAGKVEAVNTELSKENSMLQSLAAKKYGQERMRHEAANLGLALPTEADAQPQLITARKSDVAEAAARLKAAAAAANPE